MNGVCSGSFSCNCNSVADCDDKNPCTVDSCSGNAGMCSYAAVAAGTVCRAAVSLCDVAETCLGTFCPVDNPAPAGTVCRPSSGECDVEETCTGTLTQCPMDAFLASTRVCRAAQLPCDAAERCTGLSRDCPPDGLKEVGEPCRPSQGACDSVELCDGVSAQCPIDVSVADGAPCQSTLTPSCDGGGKCAAGTCSAKSTCACARDAECDDKNPCTDDVCQARRCVYTDRPVGSTCDDRNNCTTSDVCSASGFCVGVFAPCRNACSRRGVCCGGKCACDATRTGSACELFLNGTLAEVLPPEVGVSPTGTAFGVDSSTASMEQESDNTAAIAGGVVAALVAVCLVAVAIVFGLRAWDDRRATKARQVRFDPTTYAPEDSAVPPRTHIYATPYDDGTPMSVMSSIPAIVTPYLSAPQQPPQYGATPHFKDSDIHQTDAHASSNYNQITLPGSSKYSSFAAATPDTERSLPKLPPQQRTDYMPMPREPTKRVIPPVPLSRPQAVEFVDSAADGQLQPSGQLPARAHDHQADYALFSSARMAEEAEPDYKTLVLADPQPERPLPPVIYSNFSSTPPPRPLHRPVRPTLNGGAAAPPRPANPHLKSNQL